MKHNATAVVLVFNHHIGGEDIDIAAVCPTKDEAIKSAISAGYAMLITIPELLRADMPQREEMMRQLINQNYFYIADECGDNSLTIYLKGVSVDVDSFSQS